MKQAAAKNIRVYQYGQDTNGFQIWTETDVPGTWVVGPYLAIMRGVPVDQAIGSSFVIHDYAASAFQ